MSMWRMRLTQFDVSCQRAVQSLGRSALAGPPITRKLSRSCAAKPSSRRRGVAASSCHSTRGAGEDDALGDAVAAVDCHRRGRHVQHLDLHLVGRPAVVGVDDADAVGDHRPRLSGVLLRAKIARKCPSGTLMTSPVPTSRICPAGISHVLGRREVEPAAPAVLYTGRGRRDAGGSRQTHGTIVQVPRCAGCGGAVHAAQVSSPIRSTSDA